MIKKDLHVHTTYCDGKSTAEESVLSAIDKGFDVLGFSGHSYTYFDESYCMSRKGTRLYKEEISSLKEKYSDKIKILLGVEQDYYSDEPTEDYDYVIGSVHYLKAADRYIPVDDSPEILINAVNEFFSGDWYKLTRLYFDTVGDVVNRTKCDIIGHFDLITKFNENDALFSTCNDLYRSQWKQACDKLMKYGVPFEINTGAISRGYRTSPYPSSEIIDYIKAGSGKLVLSSDSHSADNIGFEFEKYKLLYEEQL